MHSYTLTRGDSTVSESMSRTTRRLIRMKWYHSILYDRPQQVRFNSALSDIAVCSTGVPQGCVSSHFCLHDIHITVSVWSQINT